MMHFRERMIVTDANVKKWLNKYSGWRRERKRFKWFRKYARTEKPKSPIPQSIERLDRQ